MVAYLTKSDASEGFTQVIDFLNISYINYALTINPDIYVSCIKQFWNTVAIKQVNDVTTLQALVDKKKVSLSAKQTSWNEFSSAMASAVICFSTGKGFSWVETPLFEGMLVEQVIEEGGDEEEHDQDVTNSDATQGDDTAVQQTPPQSPQPQPPQPQPQPQPQAQQQKLEKGNRVKVLKLQRLKKVRTSQRIDTSEDTMIDDASNQRRKIDEMDKDYVVSLMDDKEEDKKEEEAKLLLPVQSFLLLSLKDPEEESTTSLIIPADTKSKDKGEGIMVEEPKPLKKKQSVEIEEQYARKFHAELNKDVDWDTTIDHAKFNSNIEFLLKTKEQMEEEEHRAIQSINKTSAQKAAKRRKLNEEVEDLKRHLEIIPDEDDDVYTKANPLVRKFPIVDYEIINLNNKPYYKIIRADGTHQLYISFLTLLKNFDREDIEALWTLVKESAAKQKMMLLDSVFNAAGEGLSAAKQKMMMLDSVAEGTLMLLSQVKTVNDKCCC
nr:hypothetical protein [Tanacetum cinerariifolium]